MGTKPFFDNISSILGWETLADNQPSALVDVRTSAEWAFVGAPILSGLGKELIQIEWLRYPTMTKNPDFKAQLMDKVKDKTTPLIFICRSGGRSFAAAEEMLEAGYKECYNIEDGFEGELDQNGHRGKISGWKFNNLPWGQS
jgi:rhodanese-related sulfurtransferase